MGHSSCLPPPGRDPAGGCHTGGSLQAGRRSPQAFSEGSLVGQRVLVVDDDDAIRRILTLVLSDEGYEVEAAPNGAVALDFAREYPPDVILLDMWMPVMDGWQFAESYRQLPGPHAPIIVLTAAVDAAARAQQINADAYIGKPFDLQHLLELVARFAGRSPEAPSSGSGVSSAGG